MPPAISIIPVAGADEKQWRRLWDGNNGGLVNEAVTRNTWARLNDPASPVNGLLARDSDGRLCGLVHYILHPITGNLADACYMQDLYVDPGHRRRGIGRALVTALAELGQQEQWARLYWLAEANNPQAQALYSNFGVKLDFTFHVLPLQAL